MIQRADPSTSRWPSMTLMLLSAAGLTFAFWLRHAAAQERESGQHPAFDRDLNKAMTVMEWEMKQVPMGDSPDRDFAAMMIPHHQGAIDMARVELLYGKDSVLRRLAQEIIVTQQQEIVVMRGQLGQASTRQREDGAKP